MIESFPRPDFRVLVFDDASALAREAARRFTVAAGRTVDGGALFRVALSGGRTPLETYRNLAAEPLRLSVHWPSVQFFWGDERFVPPDHPDSNYRAAREALLDVLPIPEENVYPVPTGAGSPEAAASAYQETLLGAFRVEPPGSPRFDLILLGLGADGHTASLFPGALPREAKKTLVAPVRGHGKPPDRITLTPAALNAAREVMFLVAGEEKAEVLERTLGAGDPDPALPATLVRPSRGKVTWLADRGAAARILERSEVREGGQLHQTEGGNES